MAKGKNSTRKIIITIVCTALITFLLSNLFIAGGFLNHNSHNNGLPDYISRITIKATSAYGEKYTLTNKLMLENVGYAHRIGGSWIAYYYGAVRLNDLNVTSPDYVGNFGDVECNVELWDARNLTYNHGPMQGYVDVEISRSGWSQYDIYIDNVLTCTFPLLTGGYTQPAPGYYGIALFANGTHGFGT